MGTSIGLLRQPNLKVNGFCDNTIKYVGRVRQGAALSKLSRRQYLDDLIWPRGRPVSIECSLLDLAQAAAQAPSSSMGEPVIRSDGSMCWRLRLKCH